MKSLTIALLLCTGSAQAFAALPDSDYVLSIPSGTYTLSAKVLRRGDVAEFLKYGVPVGSLIPNQPTNTDPRNDAQLDQLLKDRIKANETNKTAVDKKLTDSIGDIGNEKSNKLPPIPSTVKSADTAPVDLNTCIATGLKLLKQKLRLTALLKQTDLSVQAASDAQKGLDSVINQLQDTRGKNGAVCGSGQVILENIKVPDDLTQIKILAALGARKDKERDQLLQTLALAFGPTEDLKMHDSWQVLWRRLSLAAVFTDKPLPSWDDIRKDVHDHSTLSSTTAPIELTKLTFTVTNDRTDLDAQILAGKKQLKDQYGIQ